MQNSFNELLRALPQRGVVKAIFVRPQKYAQLLSLQQATVTRHNGLEGDHYAGSPSAKRQVTLIQYEHLEVIASLLQINELDAQLLRRNIVVAGINLLALNNQEFSIGSARLKTTGLCHPCSRMEKALGPGGYNAMRGHGGITASVVLDGIINIGDEVYLA